MAFTGDTTAEVGIHVETGDASASLDKLSERFETFSKEIRDHFGGLGDAVATATEKIQHFTEAFLSFEGMKKAVEVTLELGIQTEMLAGKLGISQAAASEFMVAMDSIHASVEQVTGIMQRQNRQLKSNEDAMNAMGIVTRDATTKGLLPQQQILMNTVETLKTYKEGTDRNQAAIVAFGGRVGDLTAIMKYNKDVQEEARIKAEALGLTMTETGQASVAKFRTAMSDLSDVMNATWKIVGEALMPVLSSMAEWLTEQGPAALQVFKFALNGIVTALDIMWVGIQDIIDIGEHFVRQVTIIFTTIADVLSHPLSPDKARAAVANGMQGMEDEQKKFLGKMQKNTEDFVKRNEDRWNPGKKADTPGTGTKNFTPFDKEGAAAALDAKRAAAEAGYSMEVEFLKQELDAKRITEVQKANISRAALDQVYGFERATLMEKLALHRSETPEYRKVQEEIAKLDLKYGTDVLKARGELQAAKRAMVKEDEKLFTAAFDFEMKMLADHLDQQLLLQQQYTAVMRRNHKEESDEVQRSKIKELEIVKQIEDQKRQFATEDIANATDHQARLLDIEKGKLDADLAFGRITDTQKLQAEGQFEENIYQKKRAALEQERELNKDKVTEFRRYTEEIQKLDDAHLGAVSKNQTDVAISIGKRWGSMFDAVENAFENAAKGIAQGTQTLKQAMSNIGNAIEGQFISLGVKMLASFAKTQLGMTLSAEEGAAQRLAIESWAAIKSVALTAWSAIKKIAAYAWDAAAATYASIAEIPVVGPFLAPAAAAAAAAVVVGFASHVASAEGGYDIPAGVNPMVQAHEREMILPAKLADNVRNATGGGGLTVNISALDGQSVAKLFMDHGPALASSMRQQFRDFNPNTRG